LKTLVTASDRSYGWYVLNLVGSIQSNSNVFDQIIIYDLGLSSIQRYVLSHIRGVELKKIPPFISHWQACWSWKSWVWQDAPDGEVLYLDAGMSVLRPLTEVIKAIEKDGYFVVAQSFLSDKVIPKEYYKAFDLDPSIGKRDVLAGGVIGFRKSGDFYNEVILPVCQQIKEGYNLGWSLSEADRNTGINYVEGSPARGCELFRHDQTLLTMQAYKWRESIRVHPMPKYAGWQSPHEDPEQLIWHHRRSNTYPYTKQALYRSSIASIFARLNILLKSPRTAQFLNPANYLSYARKRIVKSKK
jgi:hypothetical protein